MLGANEPAVDFESAKHEKIDENIRNSLIFYEKWLLAHVLRDP